MKRLVSLLLVICMLVPCLANAEQFGDGELIAGEDVFSDVPEEVVQAPVEEDVVLPESDDLMMLPTGGVDGPAAYRELVLLQPTDLLGTAVDVNTIRLSWGPVAFATQYDVYRKLINETEYTHIASTPAEQLYYEDTSVAPGTVAYYRVQALNVSYDGSTPVITYSPQSNTLPFITLEAPVLNDPRGLDADTLRLTWKKVSGATTYEVEMASSVDGFYSVARKDLTGAHCNVDGMTAGKGYYFRMRAVRTFSSGEKFYSEYSEPIKCGTPMDRPTLAVNLDGSNAVLSWSESAGATGYVIYRKVGASGSYAKLTVVGDVTSYVDAGLTPGEVYYYFVYAMRPIGVYNCFSLSSETRYFTVVEGAVLCAVQNTGTNEQTIDWTGPNGTSACKGANKYLVYAATSLDGLYTMIGETTDTKFVATGLQAGATYYYKVRAVRTFSNGDVSYGPWSNVMSMPEAGTLQIASISAFNASLGQDIAGGYVGDVFNWTTVVSGGSGAYDFKYTLVSLSGNGELVLKDFSGAYTAIPEGKTSLNHNFAVVLTDEMCDLITNQKYAMQIEIKDSLGAVAAQYACEDTWNEMNFVAPRPTTQMINLTLRAGDTLELAHGICAEAGDAVLLDISNPTGAVEISGDTVKAVSNGYAAILVTSSRFKNEILIAYNISVGYAALAVNSITPSATSIKNYETLSWDINYTGGQKDYTIDLKVYCGTTLVSANTMTESKTGTISANFQPTVPGDYALEVTITSADGQVVTKRSAVTKVVKYTPVTILPSSTTAKTGDTVTWVTAYSGTNTVVRRDYTLFRDGVVIASSVGTNEYSFAYKPTVAGSYVLQVVVYEANGNRIEVTSSTVTVSAGAPVGSQTGKVTGVRVALRTDNRTSASVIFRIDKGEYVNVILEKNGWYWVEYKGSYGWMMAKYIKLQ